MGPLFSNKTYDLLQKLVRVVIPALAALYLALDHFWDLPKEEAVAGSLGALATFLGLLLAGSSKQYNKSEAATDGDLIVSESDGEKSLALGVNESIEHLTSKDSVRLRVVENPYQPEHLAE